LQSNFGNGGGDRGRDESVGGRGDRDNNGEGKGVHYLLKLCNCVTPGELICRKIKTNSNVQSKDSQVCFKGVRLFFLDKEVKDSLMEENY